jgi:hypothetical protein
MKQSIVMSIHSIEPWERGGTVVVDAVPASVGGVDAPLRPGARLGFPHFPQSTGCPSGIPVLRG